MKLYTHISLFFFCILSFGISVFAQDYTNSSFILRSPVLTVSGGRSTTSSFEFFSSVGQVSPGKSTNSSFTYQAGFLYFDTEEEESTPAPSSGSFSGGTTSSGKVIFSGK